MLCTITLMVKVFAKRVSDVKCSILSRWAIKTLSVLSNPSVHKYSVRLGVINTAKYLLNWQKPLSCCHYIMREYITFLLSFIINSCVSFQPQKYKITANTLKNSYPLSRTFPQSSYLFLKNYLALFLKPLDVL